MGLLVVSGSAALGCSSAPLAAPTPTTTSTPSSAGTPLVWVTAYVRTWNQKLNQDQDAVDVASAEASETGASTFFSRLEGTCTQLLHDATRAQRLPPAPSAPLDRAWRTMTTATATYASECLTLVRTQSNADFVRWQAGLTTLDAANASLNAAVDAVRGVSASPGA